MKGSEAERQRRIREYLAAEHRQLEDEERQLARLWARREAAAQAEEKRAKAYIEAESHQFEREVRDKDRGTTSAADDQ